HAAVRGAGDVHGRMAQVPGPFRGGDNRRHRPVGLHGEVVEAERVGDHPRVEVLVQGERLAPQRGRPPDGVLALGDRHLSQVLPLRPVQLHVPPGEQREAVTGRDKSRTADEGRVVRYPAGAVRTAAAAAETWPTAADCGPPETALSLL